MDKNDALYPIHEGKSKKKEIGDIVYNALYAISFALIGLHSFLSIK